MKYVLLPILTLVGLLVLGCSDAPKGKVRIASDMNDVVIYVDGEKKTTGGKEYTNMLLEEGNHEIKVVKKFDDRWSKENTRKIVVGAETSQKITINISELVKDGETGLMWQDDEASKSITKPFITKNKWNNRGKNWTKETLDFSGDTAVSYCENLTLYGFDDWRLPDGSEIKSILDKNRTPRIIKYFKNCASAPYVVFKDDKWFSYAFPFSNSASFSSGGIFGRNHVRCVRDIK